MKKRWKLFLTTSLLTFVVDWILHVTLEIPQPLAITLTAIVVFTFYYKYGDEYPEE